MIARILIVGYGSIGKRHLAIARELLPEAQIALFRHRVTDDIPSFADLCISSLDAALEFRPTIAVVANPATLHVDIALPLAEAGVALIIEKPLSDDLAGTDELVDVCHEYGTPLLVGYNLRFSPSLKYFRDQLHDFVVGKALSFRCEVGQFLPEWRPDTDYRDGVSAQMKLGGGVLLELSHELDYLTWIFGKVAWVMGHVSTQSDLEIDVEDSAALILGFKSEGGKKPLVGSLGLDFIRQDTTRSCTVIGSNGSLRWNGLLGTVDKLSAQSNHEWETVYRYEQQRNDTYIRQWQHFLECVAGNEVPQVTIADGIEVLKIVEAARESSERGIKVQIYSR